MTKYWKVAVDAPIFDHLTYKTNSNSELFSVGCLVQVPLGKRTTLGLITQEIQASEVVDVEISVLKEIIGLNPEFHLVSKEYLAWLQWIAEYYYYPLGTVAKNILPPLSKQEKERKSQRKPVVPQLEKTIIPNLTAEQTQVLSKVKLGQGFQPHLLFGVTGSGKTEVYLQAIDKVLLDGKRALILVPEISLTPQLVDRFIQRFGQQVAVLHSQLTDRERTNQWWEIIDSKKSILIGARSALFCPIDNLGLIIVDEEHEPSFKQDEKLKYNGRDCAVYLAKIKNCPIILGSATPSIESWQNAMEERYILLKMQNRVENRSLPEIKVVDLKNSETIELQKKHQLPYWLSYELFEKITQTLNAKKQVALFLNRRGVAQFVSCKECGHTLMCPNCDISLTLHGKMHMICHYCDYHENLKDECPKCKLGEMKPVGLGTEQIEKEIGRFFPDATLARADRDEISSRAELEELINDMETHKIDILIGTQMIAKGLDFKNLNLVGIILADVAFNLPDFRATERSFQLLTQVSGRAGRHVQNENEKGQVIIQTYNPQHPSIEFALKNDFESFAAEELLHREQLLYPPKGKLLAVRIQGPRLDKVIEASRLLSNRAQQLKARNTNYALIEVLGPAVAPLSKIRNQYRYHSLIKSPSIKALHQFYRQLLSDQTWVPPSIRIIVDVDPINLL